jgi:hypothetical protein
MHSLPFGQEFFIVEISSKFGMPQGLKDHSTDHDPRYGSVDLEAFVLMHPAVSSSVSVVEQFTGDAVTRRGSGTRMSRRSFTAGTGHARRESSVTRVETQF